MSKRIVHHNLDEHHRYLHKTAGHTEDYDFFNGSSAWLEGTTAKFNKLKFFQITESYSSALYLSQNGC